jgi:hypothetical protein
MRNTHRRILCMGVVAALLLSLAGTGVAVPQPAHKGEAMDKVAKALSAGGIVEEVSPNEVRKVPIWVLHRGHGFALNDSGDELHVLRVHIVRARRIQPIYIRELMEANKDIEEIKTEIKEVGWHPFYRGHLRLGENHYRLVNISVDDVGDNRTVNADIVERGESGETVGNISVAVMNHEGTRRGNGELTMYGSGYSGEYRVLLDVLPPGPRPLLRGR